MKRNKHLLLWSSAGVLALLMVAMVQENFLREWRVIQGEARGESGPVDVRLRQVVVPGLRATDRCVSCHVGMAAGEQGVTGTKVVAPHPQVGHDPAEFGCTVCHGGQGRATEMAEAHGDVEFWPEPMLPKKYAYAGCGSCHTHLRVPNETALIEGRSLIERHDCLSCHALDGRGGTIRPGVTVAIQAPDLSRAGATGFDPAWYDKHLAKSKAATDGPWKTSFGAIDSTGQRAITDFLSSRVGAPELVQAKSLFHSLGCRGCHRVGGVGGDDGPDLTLTGMKDHNRLNFSNVPGEHTLSNWHAEHLRWPAKIVPGSAMPMLGLSQHQIDVLTFYLMSLRRSNFPEAYWPKDRVRAERLSEREFSTDGRTLYGTFCAACHGQNGQGMRYPGMPPFPAIGNREFLAVASDSFITATIAHGRPGRRMPAWGEKEGGLRPEEIANVVGYLRELGGVPAAEADPKPPRSVKADGTLGAPLYAAHCAGCHGAAGQGIDAPALNNATLLKNATDTYFVETIARGRTGTAMKAFTQPSPVHPSLTPGEIESIVAFMRTWEKGQP
jgi:cbb3-type cytochrome c oxidase subunit III